MAIHNEISFQDNICAHLAASGWLYAKDDAAAYDRARALFPADVVAWVQASQPAALEALTKSHGAAAEAMLLERVRKALDERGTLEVLLRVVEMIGVKAPVASAQFKPALGMNHDTTAR